jgi:hypothetical protein
MQKHENEEEGRARDEKKTKERDVDAGIERERASEREKNKVAGRQRFIFFQRLASSLALSSSTNSPTAAATRRFRGLEVIRSAAEAAAAAAAAAPAAGRRDCRAISLLLRAKKKSERVGELFSPSSQRGLSCF